MAKVISASIVICIYICAHIIACDSSEGAYSEIEEIEVDTSKIIGERRNQMLTSCIFGCQGMSGCFAVGFKTDPTESLRNDCAFFGKGYQSIPMNSDHRKMYRVVKVVDDGYREEMYQQTSKRVQTTGGNAPAGSFCVFPFIYKGIIYNDCTMVNHDKIWCATTRNYDVDKKWGNCEDLSSTARAPTTGITTTATTVTSSTAAPTTTAAPIEFSCAWSPSFKDGTGDSNDEIKVGDQTGQDCVHECIQRKKVDSSINGVTVYANNEPGCWCEQKMTKYKDSSSNYKTCFLVNNSTCDSDSDCHANSRCVSYEGVKDCFCVCGYSKNGNACQRDDLSQIVKQDKFKLFSEKCVPRKNNTVEVLPKVGQEYLKKFEVYASIFNSEYASAIHLTRGSNSDRNPGVWFKDSAYDDTASYTSSTAILYIATNLNNTIAGYNSKKYIVNQWISIEIHQQKIGLHYEYIVKLDGVKVDRKINEVPREIYDVKLYVADPWHEEMKGLIRNFVFETKGATQATTPSTSNTNGATQATPQSTSNNHCPPSNPYPYNNGRNCCKSSKDKDGNPMTPTTKTCWQNEIVRCRHASGHCGVTGG